MMTHRAGNTGRAMLESGQWVKVGRKHYRHESGIEIAYNCNRWVWEILGHNEAYELLWAARHWAEKLAVGQHWDSTASMNRVGR